MIKQFCYLHNHSYLKAYSYILALYNMLIKTVADILNHQSDRFDLLLRPSYNFYSCTTLLDIFHSFHSSILHTPIKDGCKKNHTTKYQNNLKTKKKHRKRNFTTKKVDFLLVDSIRNDKFAAEIFTHLPQLKEILTISLHKSFTKSYRK